MKKLFAMLLVLCMCFTLCVACDKLKLPDFRNPFAGETPDQPGEGGGETPDQPGEGGGETPDQPGEGGGETPDQPGEGGGETPDQPGEGGGETPEKLGEQITAEQWAAMVSTTERAFPNYSATMRESLSDGIDVLVTVQVNNEEYIVNYQQNTMTLRFGAFVIDGELGHYIYDAETQKWVKQAGEHMMSGIAKYYILAGCPYAYSDLIYNEETGVYTCTYYYEDDTQLPDVVEVIFKNGALVQMTVQSGSSHAEISASNHGTTVIERPTSDAITNDTTGSDPAIQGSQMTAEQWLAFFSNLPDNFTYKSNMDMMGMSVSQLAKITKDMYYVSTNTIGVSEISWGKFVGDTVIGYTYNAETGKWDYDTYADLTYSSMNPFESIPADYALYTYNAELGAYVFSLAAEGNTVTYMLVFRDGYLAAVYMENNMGVDVEWLFSDYGTTVIEAPAEEDLMPPPVDDDTVEDEFAEYAPITEAQFNALKNNAPTNYSYTEYRNYNGEIVIINRMVDGVFFLDEQYDADHNLLRRLCKVEMNGRYVNYFYDLSTEKWQEHNGSVSTNFPLNGFPHALDDFTYNVDSCTYTLYMTETAFIELGFDSDGTLCYIGQFDGTNAVVTYFYDYGITEIPVPAAEDILPGNSSVQTGNGSIRG